MKPITQEWLNGSRDDLDVIQQIATVGHLTNMVAFHAQQAVEKVLKAILEEHNESVPKIHDLVRLFQLVRGMILFDIDEMMLKEINDVYIDARYPGEIGGLPYGKPSVEDAKRFYDYARYIFDNVENLLTAG